MFTNKGITDQYDARLMRSAEIVPQAHHHYCSHWRPARRCATMCLHTQTPAAAHMQPLSVSPRAHLEWWRPPHGTLICITSCHCSLTELRPSHLAATSIANNAYGASVIDRLPGFSPNVSLVILVANTLRVAFWFRKRFDNTMLVQSLLLIGMQLALLQALAGSKWALAKREGRQLALSPVGDFWAWDSFALYLGATALFASVVALVSSVLYRFEWYVEGLGAAAVSFESVMGLPQLTRNFMHKSTAGLSIFMVCGWLGGDFLKYIRPNPPLAEQMLLHVRTRTDWMPLTEVDIYAANNLPTSLVEPDPVDRLPEYHLRQPPPPTPEMVHESTMFYHTHVPIAGSGPEIHHTLYVTHFWSAARNRDIRHVAYFVAKGVPMVFFYGAAVQTALDASVALQLFVLYPNDDIKALLRRVRHPFKPRRSPRASSSAAAAAAPAAALNGRSPRKSPRRVSYNED
ncbi:hypothetical protein JKP88DRAFT_327415 [Tribonema minus]|uniref:Uncharacterized protein n=1 Tax=Tribonema minus TaxID=303371 RepID=A0A835YRA4_9STRA|nr:hypothetical protein JKP88DRAFT_327415 [Tribonema minus]